MHCTMKYHILRTCRVRRSKVTRSSYYILGKCTRIAKQAATRASAEVSMLISHNTLTQL